MSQSRMEKLTEEKAKLETEIIQNGSMLILVNEEIAEELLRQVNS